MNAMDLVIERPKRSTRSKVMRIVAIILGVLILALTAAHLAFKYSGDREWKLVSDKKGVKVYAMKVPGDSLRKYKAVFDVQASLQAIVAFMQDNDSELDISFYDASELERTGPQELVTHWKSTLPKPFLPRDFVVRHTFVQDPQSKKVLYALQALPDRIPVESCCVRVPLMNNEWEILPKKDGKVQISWLIDMDVGGFLPYFMINAIHPTVMTDFASHLQGYFDRPKYRNARLSWVMEP